MGPTKVVTIKDVEYDAWQWDGLDVKTLDLPDFLQKVVRAYMFGSSMHSNYTGRAGSRVYLRTIKSPAQDIMLWPGDWALTGRTPGGKLWGQIFSLPNDIFVKVTETIE